MMARLGDICISITDGSHNPPPGVEKSNFLMISSKNIDDDSITLDAPRYLSAEDFEAENRRTNIMPNDLLMTIVGTIGRVAVVTDRINKICVQRSVAVIKPDITVVNPRFLMYQIQGKRDILEKESHGVAQKGLYLKQVEQIEIWVPTICEQLAIVNQLDKVSDLIALRKRQIEKMDELVKARFVEMFGDLSSNPFGWQFKLLSDVCDVRDGTHDSPEYVDSGFPLLTSKNFTNGFVDFSEVNLISKKDFDAINQRSKVDVGDIVMPMIGTIGHPVIIDTDRLFAIKNVALIKFANSPVSNIFVREILNSDYFRNVVDEKNRGNTQKFIALGDIRKIRIPIVGSDLQKQFAIFTNQVNQSKAIVRQGLDKLETLKSALMQEYFG